MFCPFCGHRLVDGSRYCPFCEKPLPEVPRRPVGAARAAERFVFPERGPDYEPPAPGTAYPPAPKAPEKPGENGGAPIPPSGAEDSPAPAPPDGEAGEARPDVSEEAHLAEPPAESAAPSPASWYGPAPSARPGGAPPPWQAPGPDPTGYGRPGVQSYDPYGQTRRFVPPADPKNDPRGMKWYKFIIYFQLFANAFVNAAMGLSLLTGLHYGDAESAAQVYRTYPAMQGLDVGYGITCLVLAALAIVTRMALAQFRRHGPLLYYIVLVANVLFALLYAVLAGSVTGLPVLEALDMSSIVTPVTNLVMLVLTKIYFDRRKDLFIH